MASTLPDARHIPTLRAQTYASPWLNTVPGPGHCDQPFCNKHGPEEPSQDSKVSSRADPLHVADAIAGMLSRREGTTLLYDGCWDIRHRHRPHRASTVSNVDVKLQLLMHPFSWLCPVQAGQVSFHGPVLKDHGFSARHPD